MKKMIFALSMITMVNFSYAAEPDGFFSIFMENSYYPTNPPTTGPHESMTFDEFVAKVQNGYYRTKALPPKLSPDMEFHINQLQYEDSVLWADFKLIPHESKIIYEVVDYGTVTKDDQDGDGVSIRDGDCNDSDPAIIDC